MNNVTRKPTSRALAHCMMFCMREARKAKSAGDKDMHSYWALKALRHHLEMEVGS